MTSRDVSRFQSSPPSLLSLPKPPESLPHQNKATTVQKQYNFG
jgi:hypothetical protein